MLEIHFKASFCPNHRVFNVSLRYGRKRLAEQMPIDKFLSFAKSNGPLVIKGVTINFTNEGIPERNAEESIRNYLREVADSYLAYQARNN